MKFQETMTFVSLVGLCTALALFGCQDKPTTTVQTIPKLAVNQLVLTDSKGQQRAWLGLEGDQPSLLLFDKAGRIRLGLGLDLDGSPQIGLSNLAGIPVLNLAMDQDGNMGLLIVNEDGTPRVVTGVSADGQARSDLYSENGFRIFSATE